MNISKLGMIIFKPSLRNYEKKGKNLKFKIILKIKFLDNYIKIYFSINN